jgi:hypothetical protein
MARLSRTCTAVIGTRMRTVSPERKKFHRPSGN